MVLRLFINPIVYAKNKNSFDNNNRIYFNIYSFNYSFNWSLIYPGSILYISRFYSFNFIAPITKALTVAIIPQYYFITILKDN